MPAMFESRGSIFNQAIDGLINCSKGQGVPNWRALGLASAIGPFLIEVIRDRCHGIMLQLTFTDDGSQVVISPDGGEIVDGPYDGPTGLRGDPQ